jgi:hypothetical protein
VTCRTSVEPQSSSSSVTWLLRSCCQSTRVETTRCHIVTQPSRNPGSLAGPAVDPSVDVTCSIVRRASSGGASSRGVPCLSAVRGGSGPGGRHG